MMISWWNADDAREFLDYDQVQIQDPGSSGGPASEAESLPT